MSGYRSNRDSDAVQHGHLAEPQPMKVVRWRSGTAHISEDGHATICGAIIRPDRISSVYETTDWAEQVRCYNCAYRHTPTGYVTPKSGRNFPLKRECPNHPGRGHAVDSCDDPRDHDPLRGYARCTVWPPLRQSGPDGRCPDGCESRERVMRRANPALRLDLADSALFTCYHCGDYVCVGCQQVAVETSLEFCGTCE